MSELRQFIAEHPIIVLVIIAGVLAIITVILGGGKIWHF
jgi:hypothetical protein